MVVLRCQVVAPSYVDFLGMVQVGALCCEQETSPAVVAESESAR